MKDQADTLRRLMTSREQNRRPASDPAISVFLAPGVRKSRLFSPRELALLARSRAAEFRIRDESDPVAANGGNPEILARLAVVTGEDTDLVACYRRVKGLVFDESVKKMDILVCVGIDGESGEAQGRRIFTRLLDACRRFPGLELVYLGAFARGEKIRDNLAISKYLLHYQSGSRDSNHRQDAGIRNCE